MQTEPLPDFQATLPGERILACRNKPFDTDPDGAYVSDVPLTVIGIDWQGWAVTDGGIHRSWVRLSSLGHHPSWDQA